MLRRGLAVLGVVGAAAVALAFMAGLIDRLTLEGGVGSAAANVISGKRDYALSGSAVGLLRVEGVLEDVTWTIDQLHDLAKNGRVKAVVIRVDSPGGAVAPSQELFEEILKVRDEKPVVVSMGTVAASGGYYIACAADHILANPGTITGSIGVIAQFPNWEGLMGKIGVGSKSITSGKFKDAGSPFRPMTPEEEALFSGLVQDTYAQFREAVIEQRELSAETIDPYLDGRVLTGRQALELGLVDELGNLQDALDKAAELGGIDDRPPRVVEPREEVGGLFRFLTGTTPEELAGSLTGLGTGANGRHLQLWRLF